MTLSQANRLLNVTTPLGEDELVLTSFSGNEEMSRLFSYQLEMISDNNAIAAADIVGKRVTFSVELSDSSRRYFDGFVSGFLAGHENREGRRIYHAEVVPWLWFLTQTADCRIFQNKKIPDIIEQIFGDLGFSDYRLDISGTHKEWEYCVQYRETDFNFVARLMEQEGIFYYFEHEDGKHTMVIADHKGAYADAPENEVVVPPSWSRRAVTDHITKWEHRYEFRPGKCAQTDFDFEKPSTDLMTNTSSLIELPGIDKYEVYDYPGQYVEKGDGDGEVKLRMEEQETYHDVVNGESTCKTFGVGLTFTIKEHLSDSEAGKSYAVTGIQHKATEPLAYESAAGAPEFDYANSFTCIPDSVVCRPPRTTRKPTISGVQTAIVVGPSGEEIYTDKYGRVKIQFHWDREGKRDENSSCWTRVAQNWAGKNWGIVFNPRIGQEVIVDFLEGDPDRPIITGRVYNAEQMPPYELPSEQTKSTIKTRSSKDGSTDNFNELRFEDKKDEEEIYFHAERDFNRVVENNDTLKVGFETKDSGDQTNEIFNNQELKVGCPQASDGSQTTEVWKDQTTTLKTGDRNVTIEMGNDSLAIQMGNRTTKLDLGKSTTEAMQSIELKVGQSSIKVDQMGVTIKGMMIKVEGQVMTDIKSNAITKVQGAAMLQLKGGVTMIG